VLGALRALFPVVVVDCGSRLDEANAVALEIADHAVLVVTPEVPCLLAARRHLATLSRLSIRSDDRVLAVVNRQSRRSELQLPAIRRTLGIPVSQATVPDREAAFYAAVNDADPHRVDDRAVVGALRKLGRQVGLVHGEGPDEAAHSTRAGRPWRTRRPA
jgi:pilus assembly protein CpaE